jgi:chemotaxis protein CheZ
VPVLDEVLPRLRTLAGETADKLTEIATRIYEASSFQDITGQRITKVLKVLGTIEGKVGQMAVAIGYEADPNAPPPPEEPPDSEDSLLNGPSMPEVANTQADIDALFD